MPEEGRLRDDSRGLGRVLAVVTRCTALPTHPGWGQSLSSPRQGRRRKKRQWPPWRCCSPRGSAWTSNAATGWLGSRRPQTRHLPRGLEGQGKKRPGNACWGRGKVCWGGLQSPGTLLVPTQIPRVSQKSNFWSGAPKSNTAPFQLQPHQNHKGTQVPVGQPHPICSGAIDV